MRSHIDKQSRRRKRYQTSLVRDYKRRRFFFCCGARRPAFKKNPDKFANNPSRPILVESPKPVG
jgi:YHS domain-containing protein